MRSEIIRIRTKTIYDALAQTQEERQLDHVRLGIVQLKTKEDGAAMMKWGRT